MNIERVNIDNKTGYRCSEEGRIFYFTEGDSISEASAKSSAMSYSKSIKSEKQKMSDSEFILSEDDKNFILSNIINNKMGVKISEFKLPSDWETNWMDYCLEANDEEFSAPTDEEVQDSEIFPGVSGTRKTIFVYKYASPIYGASNIGSKSRDFCRNLVSISTNRLFTRSEIEQMRNPGFGKGGSNKYSILKFRGGSNCKHKWYRFEYNVETNVFIKTVSQPNQPDV